MFTREHAGLFFFLSGRSFISNIQMHIGCVCCPEETSKSVIFVLQSAFVLSEVGVEGRDS